jgi:hypothetical protein
MTTLAAQVSDDEMLCRRYGLSPDEALGVIASFGHQADDHCAVVARRLRGELVALTGITIQAGRNIPALVMAKDEAVRDLMLRGDRVGARSMVKVG